MRALVCAIGLLLPWQHAAPSARVAVRIDAAEAEAVLRIADRQASGAEVPARDWDALFATDGYRRLREREQSMGRPLDEGAFRQFVLSARVTSRAALLRATLETWTRADLSGAAARALAYLPSQAAIRATVYLVIKPAPNSFVFDTTKDPAIFLYLDPARTRAQIENTVSHELHHIGASSLDADYQKAIAGLAPPARLAATWMGAFAEGLAMLAAAGGPDVHPHVVSPPEDRARWDRDVANFDRDLAGLDRFFQDVVHERIAGEDAVQKAAMAFFGVQGPWYTVGWKMAVIVERAFGRTAVVNAVGDPRRLLVDYNRAVRAGHLALPRWSDDLLAAVEAR